MENNIGIKFIDPRATIDLLEITAGMSIGDFGCGIGYFAFPLAEKVGQTGQVYALDILKDKLESVESEAKVLSFNNIIIKRANLEVAGGSKLKENSLDWVFLVNMLFQNKSKEIIVKEAARVLKTGGKILVIEWGEKDSSFGPARNLRISKDEISELAINCGLSIIKEMAISDFHYGVILEK
ncbi:MAG TPA: hypothetical protein DCS28_03605 [Candidatus Moranbacteria bacterium]|nr:hypothetical protein [Candidatus Moranbacteria bacterium]HAT75098.1 hypothetical protein [Candidatus Moranbacteria bacterium]